MTKILRYQKVTDSYTTLTFAEPDYNLLDTGDRITELCTVGPWTYLSIPSSLELPEQSELIAASMEEIVAPSEELKLEIRAASPHVKLINTRVVERIRQLYDVNDEIKMLRIAPSAESAVYNDYAEECREWGRQEKAKLGL